MRELVTIAEKIAAKLIERKQTIAVAEILDRRADFCRAARGTRRVGLFHRWRRDLYPRRPAGADGDSPTTR